MTDNNVRSAIAAAWPGGSALARIRHQIALELASLKDGPLGPNTCLGAPLSNTLRAKCLVLVQEAAQLCYPPNGKLRFYQLVTHGRGFQRGQGGPPPEDARGGAFLYCANHSYDICLVLDLPALLKWHSSGSPQGPITPPERFASSAASRSGARQLLSDSPYDDDAPGENDDRELVDPWVGDTLPSAPPDFDNLGLRAFSGPSAANQLRRLLVQRLGAAGAQGKYCLPPYCLPPYSVPWRHLLPLVANSRAAAQHPDLTQAAFFRAFILHQASFGVFATTRVAVNKPRGGHGHDNNDGTSASSNSEEAVTVDCVAMDVKRLHRAAVQGVCSAFAAVWPGGAPLQRLKRAAARVLSAQRSGSPAGGPYTLNSGPIGNELMKKDPLAYSMIRGATGGLMSQLDETTWGGYLNYVRLEGKEGFLKLKLEAVLLAFPQNEFQDLGLGSGRPGAAAGSVAAVRTTAPLPPPPAAASSSSTGPAVVGLGAGRSPSTSDVGHAASSGHVGSRVMPPVAASLPGPGGAAAANDRFSGDGRGVTTDPWVVNTITAASLGLPVPVPVLVPGSAGPASGGRSMESAPSPVDPSVRWATAGACFPVVPSYTAGTVAGDALNGSGGGGGAPGGWQDAAAGSQTSHVHPTQALTSPSQSAPDVVVIWVRTASEFESMSQHCASAGQMGLSVHGGRAAVGGGFGVKAEVAAVYAAAATTAPDDSYGAALDLGSEAASWPAAVYLFECAAVAAAALEVGAGGAADSEAAAAAATISVLMRTLLENPYVVKVAHGAEQAASLATICGATTVAPLLDTRVLVAALTAMLPPLPPPPAVHSAGGALAAVGPLLAAARAKLAAHAGALREALAATGLWSERPELLEALVVRQAKALREEAFGVPAWSSNPAAHEPALVAAAAQLPELWEALTHEAVPWVAMAATATAMEAALTAAQRQQTSAASSGSTSSATATVTATPAAVGPRAVRVQAMAAAAAAMP